MKQESIHSRCTCKFFSCREMKAMRTLISSFVASIGVGLFVHLVCIGLTSAEVVRWMTYLMPWMLSFGCWVTVTLVWKRFTCICDSTIYMSYVIHAHIHHMYPTYHPRSGWFHMIPWHAASFQNCLDTLSWHGEEREYEIEGHRWVTDALMCFSFKVLQCRVLILACRHSAGKSNLAGNGVDGLCRLGW